MTIEVASVGDLTQREFVRRLRGDGLGIRLGPFTVAVRSDVHEIDEPLARLYRDYPVLDGERVFSFHVRLQKRRAGIVASRRRVRFSVDGRVPHEDLPRAQSLAVLEWGINLVMALRTQSLLLLHAAAVERFGRVLLLPAWPGFGKTTLCAALAHRGWRLFSDEFGLLHPESSRVLPIPRPMPLKNESIEVIRAFAPDAELGPTILNTRKGTIAHVKPPAASIHAVTIDAPAEWIVFPRWEAGSKLSLEEMPKAEAFMMLATNAFNYEVLGERGFAAVRRLVTAARCFRLVYSDLGEAVAALDRIAAEHA